MRFPDHPEFFERAVDLIRSRERCPFAQHKLINGGIGADKDNKIRDIEVLV